MKKIEFLLQTRMWKFCKMQSRYSFQLLMFFCIFYTTQGKILRAGKEFYAPFFLVDSNARIKIPYIRRFSRTESERECSSHCIREEDCLSFNRHNEKGTCELLDVSKFDNVTFLRRDKGWTHFETDNDAPNVGSVCMQLSPCKEYQVCEDTFRRSKPYICRCRDGFKGRECKTYKGPGSSKENPTTSSCRLLQMKFKSFPDGDYWIKGRKNTKHCERRVDGRYSMWSSYGPCSSTVCRVNGTQERNRTCTNPTPKGGGRDCRELGKGRDVKPCTPQCQHMFFATTPHTLTKNKLIGTILTWHKVFKVQFQLKIDPSKLIKETWYNVVHLTIGGKNKVYGDRIATVFLYPFAPKVRITISSAVNGDKSDVTNVRKNNDYYKNWVKIDISQRLEVSGSYMFRVVIDDEVIKDVENTDARDFENVKIFASNPWERSHGEIKSLLVEGGVLK